MSYQLHSEDERTYTLVHPNGHTLVVAKQGLDDRVHSKVRALPKLEHMAKGGEIPGLKDNASQMPEPKSEEEQVVTQAMQAPAQTQYAQLYDKTLEQQKMFNPGEPEALQDQTALGVAQHQKDADEASKYYQQQSAQSAYQRLQAENAQKQQLGIPAQQLPQMASTPQAGGPQVMPNPAGEPAQAEPAQMPGADTYGKVFSNMEGANAELGKATQGYIGQVQNQSKAYQDQLKAYNAQSQAAYKAIQSDLDQNKQAYMSGKIDPNHVWQNKTTGQKILAGISVLLGGIGSGLTGTPNGAAQMIDKMIERDIDSQKANQDKQSNLYHMNMQRFQNQMAADAATRLQMYNAYQAQVQTAGLTLSSVQAKNAAQMEHDRIELQKLPIMQQLAHYAATAQSVGATGRGGIPVGQEPPVLMMDPKYQEKRVLVNGRAYQYAGKEEAAQDFRNVETIAGGITGLVRQLDSLGPKALIPGTGEHLTADALRAQLATEIPKLKSMQIGAKRVNETEADRATEMISNPSSFSQVMNKGVKNQLFFKTLEDELERGRTNNLMGYKGASSLQTRKAGFTPNGI